MSKGRIIAVIGALFAIYIAATPYITVRQMKAAAESRDGGALSEYIEFPSVRQSLKDQMNAMFLREMADDKMKDNPFAALGAAFAGAIVDKMVEAYVTPAGITELMAGERPKAAEPGKAGGNSAREVLSDASMSYESWNKFVVNIRDESDWEGKLVLRRRGLGWKVTEIVLPREAAVRTGER